MIFDLCVLVIVIPLDAPVSSRSLVTLGVSRRHEILYNLGIQLLFSGRPAVAFDCLVEAVQIYHTNPRLWLRLAECCIVAFQLVSVMIAFLWGVYATSGYLNTHVSHFLDFISYRSFFLSNKIALYLFSFSFSKANKNLIYLTFLGKEVATIMGKSLSIKLLKTKS